MYLGPPPSQIYYAIEVPQEVIQWICQVSSTKVYQQIGVTTSLRPRGEQHAGAWHSVLVCTHHMLCLKVAAITVAIHC